MNEYLNMFSDLKFTHLAWQIATPMIFSLSDILTGYIQAVINHDVDSQKMRVGLLHKALIIIVLILSYVVSYAFGLEFISSFISIYIIFMESVSITENLKKAGVEVGKIGQFLKDKTQETNTNINNLIKKVEIVVDENKKETEEKKDE